MPHISWIHAISLGALLVASQAAAQSQVRQSPAWEYREVQLSTSSSSLAVMNRLGAEGWELVNVVSACSSIAPNSANTTISCQWWAYFKRRSS